MFNIEPLSIKEIQTYSFNEYDALNLLEISKSEIRKIKYLCGIVVQWRNPLPSKKGSTQCSKCTMYGLVAANCFRKEECLGCEGSHDYLPLGQGAFKRASYLQMLQLH